MRILTASAFGLLALASLPVAAEAVTCPPGWVEVCATTPGRLPRCHCERIRSHPTGDSGVGNRGKAEIHKQNVPTAKPNKGPGPNN